MKLDIVKKEDKLIATLTTQEVAKRVDDAIIDLIAVRIADRYVQEYSSLFLGQEAIESIKEIVQKMVVKRLTDETTNRVQKS